MPSTIGIVGAAVIGAALISPTASSTSPAGWLNDALAIELAYGPAERQKLDFYRATRNRPAPLMVFIHGGGWKDGDKRAEARNKPAFFGSRGIAFAAVNYRLVPKATIEMQAIDIAESIAWLRANAHRLNVDPERILVSGHSAGAQLAALLTTNPAYLEAAGVPLRVIRGTMLLDGAGYDIVRQMSSAKPAVKRVYQEVFGTNAARHERLSPLAHAHAPNAGAFLILYVTSGDASGGQSEQFAEALLHAGTSATVVGIANSNHLKINSDFGLEGDAATRAATAFLEQVLPEGRDPGQIAQAKPLWHSRTELVE